MDLIKLKLVYLNYQLSELQDIIDNRPCIKPASCNPPIIPRIMVPQSEPEICKDYCYFQMCYIEDLRTLYMKEKIKLDEIVKKNS